MERDGLVRIGVDDFLQHVTGTITGIKLKETGEYVKRGEKILTIIRDGKQLSLSAPVSGIIRSQNTDLYLDSSIINSSPYTDGWIYLVEPKNWIKDIQMMFATDRFREWITGEFIRLKDFLATVLASHYPEYSLIVLQDGGELTDNLLEKLGPEVWEDFQVNFIDKSR
jgi:glycine cleavage system H lipoate-binding protein